MCIMWNIVLQILLLASLQCSALDVNFKKQDISLQINDQVSTSVDFRNLYSKMTIEIKMTHDNIIKVEPGVFQIDRNETVKLEVTAVGLGHTQVYVKTSDSTINVDDIFMKVGVYKTPGLDTLSDVMGWVYFSAWTVSYYPQIIKNWRRKSVVGLSFDFVYMNIVGFVAYSTFNLGLYLIPEVKHEYGNRYPRSSIPVKLNDIFFAVLAFFSTSLMGIQCMIFERQNQTISYTARGILGAIAAFLTISLILVWTKVIVWLDFLYYCSYVKLIITMIKYTPQIYLNFKRKSTVGFSILNICLDFTGGVLGIMQMIVDAVNYDEWNSIFGNLSKVGLGLFSIFFDVCLMIQNFIVYRKPKQPKN